MNRRKAVVKKVKQEPVNNHEEMQEAPVEENQGNPTQKQYNEHKTSKYIDSSHVVKTRLANREQLRLSKFSTALAASLPILEIMEAEPEVLEPEPEPLESDHEDSESKKEPEKKCPYVFKVPKLQCPNCPFNSERSEEVADHIIKTYTAKEGLDIWEEIGLIPKSTQALINKALEKQQKGAYLKIDINNSTKVLKVPATCPLFSYLAKTGVEVSNMKGRNYHNFDVEIMFDSKSFKVYFILDPVDEHQKKVHEQEALKQAHVFKGEGENMKELLDNEHNAERKAAVAAYLKVAPETSRIVKAVTAAPICEYGTEVYNCRTKQSQVKEESKKQMKKAEDQREKDRAEFAKRTKAEENRHK